VVESEQAFDDVERGEVFADDRAHAGQHEHEQRARNTIAPPARPVNDIVAQPVEIGDARTMQPELGRRTQRAGRDAGTERFERTDDEHCDTSRAASEEETARRGVWVDIAPVAIEIYNPSDPKLKAQVKERIDKVKTHNLKLLKRFNAKIAFGSDWYGRTPVNDVLYLQKLDTALESAQDWAID